MLNYHVLKNWDFGDIEFTYTRREPILFALGIGFGFDPTDPNQLCYVYEKNLDAVPSMASIMGYPGPWWRHESTGVTWSKVLHGDQDMRFLKTLPVEGTVIARNRVCCVHDVGPGRYALVQVERQIRNKASGELLATGRRISILRGDGGFSTPVHG